MTDGLDARNIIFDYFDDNYPPLHSLMGYLDTDTLVAWFVDDDFVGGLDDDECDFIMNYYDLHCAR